MMHYVTKSVHDGGFGMSKALCFGSLNIDYVYEVDHFVRAGETLSSATLSVYTGGKGLNQSCALSRAGLEVYHAGRIGLDGAFLLEELKKSNVDTSFVKIAESPRTGNAIIQRDSTGGNCILLYGGANRAITEEQIRTVFNHFTAGDYLILQNEINGLDSILRMGKEHSMITVLNPSPVDETLTGELLDMADWLILNEVEAAALTKTTSDDEDTLVQSLREHFPQNSFVLTLGSRGSCAWNKRRRYHQDAFPVAAVDTTAAGDTFTGYFVAGLELGFDLPRCLEIASRAAAIAVSRHGAAPSIPWMSEV